MSDAKIYIQSWVGNVVFDDIDCLIQLADRFNMTIGLIHNGRQYTINPKDTQMDVLKRYDSENGVAALERGGEGWTCPDCHSKRLRTDTACPCGAIIVPAPAPATVEKFNSYKFDKHGFEGGANFYLKVFVGEVVATPIQNGGGLAWSVPFGGVTIIFSPTEYRALVTMMVDNKYWEKINE